MEQELRERTRKHNQDHVWQHWPRFDEAERRQFLADLSGIDFEQLDMLIRRYVREPAPKFSGELAPAEIIPTPESDSARRDEAAAREAGERLLRAGVVAALVVAGGQGTRLGFDGPKGSYPISPIHNKPLFQLHAERILATARRYGQPVPWCVMTSEATDAATRVFFGENDFFGLPKDDVIFFAQGMVPSVDRDGKLLVQSGGRIAMNPDGHGGTVRALHRSGALDELASRGIETISYFQVDNVLVKAVDPVFIGHHHDRGAEMSAKVMRKRDWAEKLGIVGMVDGVCRVVEYMNVDEATLKLTEPDGSLKYWAGNPAIHQLDVAFLQRLNEQEVALPFNRSEKKVPFLDDSGVLVEPTEPNGIKFETFIFDALPQARQVSLMEIRRDEEFAAVKNPDSAAVDCPASARAGLQKLWARWLADRGVNVPIDNNGNPTVRIEISPFTALDAGELREALPPGFCVEGDVDL